ncbi:hypothetical protein RI528_18155 [Aeromonas veronii]|uniref:hypothetical protein n=1 Tax=Aeromonas veronii TaxID=654 RepID=UPI003434C79D
MALEARACAEKCFTELIRQSKATVASEDLRFEITDKDDAKRLRYVRVTESCVMPFQIGIAWLEVSYDRKDKNTEEQKVDERYIIIFDNGFFDSTSLILQLKSYGLDLTYNYPSLFIRTMGDGDFNINIKAGLQSSDISVALSDCKEFDPVEFIRDYYESFFVMEVVDDSSILLKMTPEAFFCLLLLNNGSGFELEHDSSLISNSIAFITSGNYLKHFPYENLIMSLSSPFWKHSFLEAYRVIESLFSIPKAIHFRDEVENIYISGGGNLKKGDVRAIDIADLISSKLPERKSELNYLTDLLNFCIKDESSYNNITRQGKYISNVISLYPDEWDKYDTNIKNEKIGRYIYSVRCQDVHLEFKRKSTANVNDSIYRNLVTILWDVAFSLYEMFDDELSSTRA